LAACKIMAFDFVRRFLYDNRKHTPRTSPMATKRASTKARQPTEADRFEAWLIAFDAKEADLRARLDSLLHTLGVEPVAEREIA
jgi:hypothetical protein